MRRRNGRGRRRPILGPRSTSPLRQDLGYVIISLRQATMNAPCFPCLNVPRSARKFRQQQRSSKAISARGGGTSAWASIAMNLVGDLVGNLRAARHLRTLGERARHSASPATQAAFVFQPFLMVSASGSRSHACPEELIMDDFRESMGGDGRCGGAACQAAAAGRPVRPGTLLEGALAWDLRKPRGLGR